MTRQPSAPLRSIDPSLVPELRPPLSGEGHVADLIDPLVRAGELYERLPGDRVSCLACAHRCTIPPGGRGICQVRYNLEGHLYVPWGYVAALNCDPTEKKPFFHVFPGSSTLTFGMLGCDLHCPHCQNWDIAQALRDPAAGHPPVSVSIEQMVAQAQRHGARCLASSYNEPLITSEWARAIFGEAQRAGLTTLVVSNGNATPEALDYLRPVTDGFKVDLKTMRDASYRQMGAVLIHILDAIYQIHQMGFWLEIVTLVIPGFNDSEAELRDAAHFIASVSPDIPWHLTAFHPDYRLMDARPTDARDLMRAAEIGYAEGLHYVYTGNLPGQTHDFEDTRCPTCRQTLVRRRGYRLLDYRITSEGRCPACRTVIAGMWASEN